MPIMECTLPEGGNGYKWGDSGHCYAERADAEKQAAAAHANGFKGDTMEKAVKLAIDKSMRHIDEFGRLHVAASNITKAVVNPYRGAEIPDGDKLNLEPDRIYFLLRDPAELLIAAPTLNNCPLLDRHIAQLAEAPQKEFIVGALGTDAAFADPYLRNSLIVWDQAAIDGIETKEQCELSASYSYVADMTPGMFQGVKYDGIMRNIKFNHVALVEVGRAGPDVLVGDSKLLEVPKMNGRKKQSAIAIAIVGALRANLAGKLAQDAKLPDLAAIVGSVRSKTFAKDKQKIAERIKTGLKDIKLAKDADLDDVLDMLDAMGGGEDFGDDEDPAVESMGADGGTPGEQLMKLLSGANLDPALMAQISAICGGMSADALPGAAAVPPGPEGKEVAPPGVTKQAMDAAISTAAKNAEAATVARMNAMHLALKEVHPFVGEVLAQDSAEAVYKLALDQAKVDLTDVHPSAYRAMVGMLGKQAPAKKAGSTTLAADAANAAKSFAEAFPKAALARG